jgi:hypothetical protein
LQENRTHGIFLVQGFIDLIVVLIFDSLLNFLNSGFFGRIKSLRPRTFMLRFGYDHSVSNNESVNSSHSN